MTCLLLATIAETLIYKGFQPKICVATLHCSNL